MRRHYYYILFLLWLLQLSCQQEVDPNAGLTPSAGTLQAGAGDCLPKTVNGTYTQGSALSASSNTISVQVSVSATGSYLVYTDTINGMFFRSNGVFAATGLQSVILKGNGTPAAVGTHTFKVTYTNTTCNVQVTTVASGGGGTAATYTLQGSPGACMNANVIGTYTQGIVLNSGNRVDISVNVTVAGTYMITTPTVNGMHFTGGGTFSSTGVQTITLSGIGTPVNAGNGTFTVTAGATSCTYVINVGAAGSAAGGSLGGGPGACTTPTINGTYTQGITLDGTNSVQIQVNVTTIGNYTIGTNMVAGFNFSATGTFSSTGPQTVILNGSGVPSASGNQTFTINFGTSSCTFSINVGAGAAVDWKFTEAGVTYQGTTDQVTYTSPVSPIVFLVYFGTNPNSDIFSIAISDITGGIQTNEIYNSNASGQVNSSVFGMAGSADYGADSQTPGVNIQVKVTSHNTSTKTVTGTFSGTAKTSIGQIKTITNGQFTAIYQ